MGGALLNVSRILLESSLFGLLVLMAALTLQAAAHHYGRSAADRCLLWQWAIAMLAVSPLISWLSPGMQVHAIPTAFSKVFVDPTPTSRTAYYPQSPEALRNYPSYANHSIVEMKNLAAVPPASLTQRSIGAEPPHIVSWPHLNRDVLERIAQLWLVVALVLLVDVAWGQLRLNALARRCKVVQSGPVFEAVRSAATSLGLRQPPRLLMLPRTVPMAWGWRRPTVLLPDGAVDWSAVTVSVVLLHELSHIIRRDWIAQRLARIVCCVFWFHPLAWTGLRQVRRESELACDDCVINAGVSAPDYAERLLEIVQIMKFNYSVSRRCPTVAIAKSKQIQDRLGAILDPARSRSGLQRQNILAVGVITLMLAPLAVVHVFAQQPVQLSTNTSSAKSTSSKPKPIAANAASKQIPHKISEADARAIRARLNEQSKQIAVMQADHKRETEVLRKQIDTLKRQNEEVSKIVRIQRDSGVRFVDALQQLELERNALEDAARKSANSIGSGDVTDRSGKPATNDHQQFDTNIQANKLAAAQAELNARRAEVAALTAGLKRKETLMRAGQLDAASVDNAMVDLNKSEAELQRREAELAVSKAERQIHLDAELNKRKAEIDALSSRLAQQRDLTKAGAGTQVEINAAIAQLERALAELKMRQAELAKKP